MKRIVLICSLSVNALSLYSQDIKIIKYYDSLWFPTSKSSAFFYTEFVKKDSLYNCFSYWVKSGKLNCKSVFKDTLFAKPADLLQRYYESGQVEDSTFSFENGKLKDTYHFYLSGKLWAHYYYDQTKDKYISEGYDENGNPIKNFVYLKDAEFPGGTNAWMQYLLTSLNTNVPAKNGAGKGSYKVIIRFIVDINGKVSNIQAETEIGYGMEEEAIRVIKKSPKWTPQVLLGELKKTVRRQPVTFEVTDKL